MSVILTRQRTSRSETTRHNRHLWYSAASRARRYLNDTLLFHVSTENHHGETFIPRVPGNAMVDEDDYTPRVCFSSTIYGALDAVTADSYDVWVHMPVDYRGLYVPNSVVEKVVPDAKFTKEVWLLEPVRLRAIGKVQWYFDTSVEVGKVLPWRHHFNYYVVVKAVDPLLHFIWAQEMNAGLLKRLSPLSLIYVHSYRPWEGKLFDLIAETTYERPYRTQAGHVARIVKSVGGKIIERGKEYKAWGSRIVIPWDQKYAHVSVLENGRVDGNGEGGRGEN